MGSAGSKLHCRCDQQQHQQQTSNLLEEALLLQEKQQIEPLCHPTSKEESAAEEYHCYDNEVEDVESAVAVTEFSLRCLPYQCQRLIADHLSTDDLLSLCQTSPDNCSLFGADVFWAGISEAASASASASAPSGAFESLNAALERKLCLPAESLNGTYLPSLEDADSYSGRVVYLHDLNCRGDVRGGGGGSGGSGGRGGVCGGVGGRGLCIHDVVTCVPRGTYQVSLRAKLGPNWRLKGVTEVQLIPDSLASPLKARIPERRWCDLAFRHGYEHWFCISLGRINLNQSCSLRVQIVNSRVSKSQLKEGVYLDHIELAPVQCPLADFTRYRRRVTVRQRRLCDSACQVL